MDGDDAVRTRPSLLGESELLLTLGQQSLQVLWTEVSAVVIVVVVRRKERQGIRRPYVIIVMLRDT
jgi:hypothetical protein